MLNLMRCALDLYLERRLLYREIVNAFFFKMMQRFFLIVRIQQTSSVHLACLVEVTRTVTTTTTGKAKRTVSGRFGFFTIGSFTLVFLELPAVCPFFFFCPERDPPTFPFMGPPWLIIVYQIVSYGRGYGGTCTAQSRSCPDSSATNPGYSAM